MRRDIAVIRCGRAAARLLRRLDGALMPERCAFCGTRTGAHERAICHGCRADLPWIGPACSLCADPLPADTARDTPCAACQRRLPPFVAAAVPLRYAFPVDAGLRALKFRRRLYYATAFGALLCEAMERLPGDVDALLPVPLHWRRQAWRGFNQARELGRPVARRFGLPYVRGVVRRRATPPQSALEARTRRRNLRGAFVVRRRPACRHVVLIDDVITTGATLRELARTLLENGVEAVSVLAAARAAQPSPGPRG